MDETFFSFNMESWSFHYLVFCFIKQMSSNSLIKKMFAYIMNLQLSVIGNRFGFSKYGINIFYS